MNINVTFLPAEVSDIDLSNTVCIILDIFRATTSITTAMANGCKAIYPVVSVEEAHAQSVQTGLCLLAGERQSIKIDGFDLGNSPYEFSKAVVENRHIIMTTTNGTVAIRAAQGSYRTLIGSFLNAHAVCKKVLEYGNDVLLACAGTDRMFSLEDALCAGYLVDIIHRAATEARLTDAACAAQLMYLQAKDGLIATARNSRNGKRLCEINHQDDVEYCFQKDIVEVVPEYKAGVICLQQS